MRCKKHLTDLSSSVGVCASCLRERLFALIAAQSLAQNQAPAVEDRRKPDSHPPPLIFPRSVSPYISSRRSDNAAWPHSQHHHRHHILSDQRFFSTPQVGPSGDIVITSSYKKKHSSFSLFSNLFRSKSKKMDSDPGVSMSNSRESCTASSSSPSWFATIIPGRWKKQSRLFSFDEVTAGDGRRHHRNRDRGMSPARYSDYCEEEECHGGSAEYSSESSQGWRQTPRRAAAAAAVKRDSGRPSHHHNMSGMAFCLSPLVRASPNRQWKQKGMAAERAVSCELRAPAKPHLSTAASYCANRSRKLADFGRSNDSR